MNVITNSVVPPTLIVVGANVLETVGRLGVTASRSAAVQVPVTQPAPEFVTPEGTEIEAVLVTCVCARTGCSENRKKNTHRQLKNLPANCLLNKENDRRHDAFSLASPKEMFRNL